MSSQIANSRPHLLEDDGVGVLDPAERLVAEHDPEPERVVGALRSQTVISCCCPAAPASCWASALK